MRLSLVGAFDKLRDCGVVHDYEIPPDVQLVMELGVKRGELEKRYNQLRLIFGPSTCAQNIIFYN